MVICIHYVAACLLTAPVDLKTDLERVGREIKEGVDLEKLYQKNMILFNRDMFRKKLFSLEKYNSRLK